MGFQDTAKKVFGSWMVLFFRILVMIDNAYQSTSDTNLAVIDELANRKTARFFIVFLRFSLQMRR